VRAILTIRLDIETDDRSTEILARIVEAGRLLVVKSYAPHYGQGPGTADGFLDTYEGRFVQIREPSGRVVGTVGIETEGD